MLKMCLEKTLHLGSCTDCENLEDRVSELEDCCENVETELADKATIKYVDDEITEASDTINGRITEVNDDLNERIDNIPSSSVTNLWKGSWNDMSQGDTLTLNDSAEDYQYIDIYYGATGQWNDGYLRVPSALFASVGVNITSVGLSPVAMQAHNVSVLQALLTVSGNTVTVAETREWSWNGVSNVNASYSTNGEVMINIYQIDGVN